MGLGFDSVSTPPTQGRVIRSRKMTTAALNPTRLPTPFNSVDCPSFPYVTAETETKVVYRPFDYRVDVEQQNWRIVEEELLEDDSYEHPPWDIESRGELDGELIENGGYAVCPSSYVYSAICC